MITYIVASNNPAVLERDLMASLVLADSDDVVVVENPVSIATAYNEGAARATNPVRCYVHHDVQVLDPLQLRSELLAHCRRDVGIVGVVGTRTAMVPWWDGDGCGSVTDSRVGLIDFGGGGEPCAYLDGLLLATAQPVIWDESFPGFHLYDHDVCQQMLARGLANFCIADGRSLVRHNTRGATSVDRLPDWAANVTRFQSKWHMRPEEG